MLWSGFEEVGNRARDWMLSLAGDVQKGAQGVPLTAPPVVNHTHRTFVVNGTHTHNKVESVVLRVCVHVFVLVFV